jgi:tight adherence protein B
VAPVSAVAALAGATLAGGLVLLVIGLRNAPAPTTPPRRAGWPAGGSRRALLAIAAMAAVGLATRWPAPTLLAGALGWASPSLFHSAAANATIARIEAVAAWTEMLQGLLAASAGLEQAVVASVRVAPHAIRAEVAEVADRLRDGQPLPAALLQFADRLDDPTADLVVAALRLAAAPDQKVGQLRAQLAELATATRETATMRLRVETGRAKVRSAARIITVVTSAFTLALLLGDRAYLTPFATPTGQLVLLAIGACYTAAYWLLARMAHIAMPDRFLLADPPQPTRPQVDR